MPTLIDEKSLSRLNALHPSVRQSAIDAVEEACARTPVHIHVFITQGLRSFAESDALYQQGRTKPGAIVTNAPAGRSYHNYGLAFDIAILRDGKMYWSLDENWQLVISILKKHGWEWGGDWKGTLKDYPHFEKKGGRNWRELLAKYQAGDFIFGTKYVNI